MNVKKCADLGEVRCEIDRIDEEIVRLISERGVYVKQAADFKKDENDVKAPDRQEAVIRKVRRQTTESGGDPDITEAVYRTMIDCFIKAEAKEFNAKKEGK